MDALRIIPLGGFANVTQNMFAYHFLPEGKEVDDQILIVDCGVGFPEEDEFGVDLVIPDVEYFEEKKEKIVGMVLTHGHEDHIGAVPFVLPRLGNRFPIWSSKLVSLLLREKFEEMTGGVKINVFKEGEKIKLGRFLVSPIRVTHSLPDTYHFFIETPVGNFYHGSDFKFDQTPPDGVVSDFPKIVEAGQKGVTCLLSDCLGADKDGFSPSESVLDQIFEDQIRRSRGRVFVTAISSNIYRWQKAIESSRKFNRKICLLGFSIEKNIKVASELGYLKIRKEDLVKPERANLLPDNKLTFLVAGSLGQVGSSLEKVVLGKHKVEVKKGDKFIFSSPDYIPGTAKAIHHLMDVLIQKKAEVVYDTPEETLHVSGHAYRQEMALLINLIKPKFLFPIGGEWRQIHHYDNLAKKLGYKSEAIVLLQENNAPTFWSSGKFDLNFKFSRRNILVDGLGIGDVGQTVLRDRKILAEEGMIVAIILIDQQTGNLAKPVSVVSRGFVYLKENKKFLGDIAKVVEIEYQNLVKTNLSVDSIRSQIQGKIEEYIFKEIGRQPMVLPVILEI